VIEKYYKTVRNKLAKSEGWGVKPKGVYLKTTTIKLKQRKHCYIMTQRPKKNNNKKTKSQTPGCSKQTHMVKTPQPSKLEFNH
jgi:hypothetical protein